MSTAKLKPLIYILSGFIISWFTSKMLDYTQSLAVLASIPLIGFLHEALLLLASIAVKAQHRFAVNGLLLGFRITTESIANFILIALMPQILNILLAVIFIVFKSNVALALIIIHIAISAEDCV